MDERTSRVDVSYDGHTVEKPSPHEAVRQLGAEIAAVREELTGLVAELDRRRREMLDLRLQARRHAVGVTVAAASLVGAAAGTVWLRMWRARRRDRLLSRAARLREAVGRMIDQPDRVAAEQRVPGKIVTAAATAAAATIINRILGRAVEAFIDRYREAASTGAERERAERAA
jgi:hypothetical protein